MSRSYESTGPVVINEALLKEAVEEQGPKGQGEKVAKKEGISFNDVTALRLDFKNILKINNLWSFTGLVKLQLDNNIIERMEGFSLLVHLKWLDLSFNNIEVIEGLDELTKLTDLTLFNNRINKINNMDKLHELQVFSIGNNNLTKLENLLYLRRFTKLNTLNLNGNPICKETTYNAYTIAYLPLLVYLDYRLVDTLKREAAIEQYKYSIEEITSDEEALRRKLIEEEEKQSARMIEQEAYVEDLNGSFLFNAMLGELPESSFLSELLGMSDLLEEYKEEFVPICVQLHEFGLSERLKRQCETELFFTCTHEAVENNRSACVKGINEFDERKLEMFAELLKQNDQETTESQLTHLTNMIAQLSDLLLTLEMQLVDQLEETIKDFERNMLDMTSTFVENVQEKVSRLRVLETSYQEKLSDIAVVTLEKLMKGDLEEELSEDVKMLFVDKDTIMNTVAASHDAHSFKIDNMEDGIVTRVNAYVRSLVENLHADEIKRNRARVTEINNLLDHYRDELETFEHNNFE